MAQATGSEAAGPRSSFRYTAVRAGGNIVRGKIKATSEVAAQNVLVERGLTPISLEKAPAVFSLEEAFPGLFKVKLREVITFSRQMATLLDSGMPLLAALNPLQIQTSASRTFKRVLGSTMRDLDSGVSFSEAISRHPTAFTEIYVRTIAVGESTGNLQLILRELAQHMETQEAFAKRLKSALTYPTIIMVVAVAVGIPMMLVVLPPLAELFDQLGADLPITTRVMLAASGFTKQFQTHILVGAGILVPAFLFYIKRPSGRRFMDRARLKIPMIGPAVQMSELARMTGTMSMLINAGVSLQDIMEMLPQTMGNSLFRDAIEAVRRGLILGQGLANPMGMHPIFPPLFMQMVRVGEETNTLEVNLKVLSDFYGATSEERISAIISMITPVTTLLMGGVGGFIALSVIMPMYSMMGNF